MQRHGQQRDGCLLARGQQHIHLSLAGQRVDLTGKADEIIRHAAHRRHHHHHSVSTQAMFAHTTRHILDAVCIEDGCAAEFLDNQRHRSQSNHGLHRIQFRRHRHRFYPGIGNSVFWILQPVAGHGGHHEAAFRNASSLMHLDDARQGRG